MSDNSTQTPEVKHFIRSILRFMKQQLDDNTITSESAESLEVAVQCLENAYNLDTSDGDGGDGDDSSPFSHIDLYQLFLNSCVNVRPETKAEAEQLKNDGNQLMQSEKYQEALNCYNQAITKDATNPVFYCNRAAAYSKMGEYLKAIEDCKMSLRYDPKYSKAYARIGLAYSKLGRHVDAQTAYRSALLIEPDNEDYQNNLAVTELREQARIAANRINGLPSSPSDAASGVIDGPDITLESLQNVDLGVLRDNPSIMNLASRIMSDPGMMNVIGDVGGYNNVNTLIESGRQLAIQMFTGNPALFNEIRDAVANIRGNEGAPGGTDPTTTQTPPGPGGNNGGDGGDGTGASGGGAGGGGN